MIIIAIILWAIVILGAVAVVYGSVVEARRVQTDRLEVRLPRLPVGLEGLRIVHIGDTHCKPGRFYEPLFRRMVEAVNAAEADLVLVSGDLAAGGENTPIAARWLGQCRGRLGVYAVPGNHDLNVTMERWLMGLGQGFDVEEERRWLAEAGVTLLHNESVVIEHQGVRILLLGVGDVSSGVDDLEEMLKSAPEGDFTILLTHSPDILDQPGVEVADLVLCGHTHAGQMMLPGLGPVWSPVWRVRSRGVGLLAAGDVVVHVTRGIGTSWPVRLGCPPQVAVLELARGPVEGKSVPPTLAHRPRSKPPQAEKLETSDRKGPSVGGEGLCCGG